MNYVDYISDFRSRQIVEFHTTRSKIKGFAEYVAGWHFGEGVPPSQDIIERASRIETYLRILGFAETDAFLGISGEVMVTGYRGNHYIEVLAEVDGQFGLVYEHGDDERINEEHHSEQDLRDKLKELVDQLWNASDLSTSNTTIGDNVVSKAWHSRILQAEEFLSLTEPAWTQARTQSVPTSLPIMTPEYPVILQYFGSSTPRYYRTAVG